MHKQLYAVHSIITATNVRKLIEEIEGKGQSHTYAPSNTSSNNAITGLD
jgi:hypothetical protein